MVDAIAVREREIGAITDRLLSSSAESVEARIAEIRNLVERGIQNLSDSLNENSPLVKQELHKHRSPSRCTRLRTGWNGIMRRKVHGICCVQMKNPLARSQWLRTRMRGVLSWLRGLDLNQRPLGYE